MSDGGETQGPPPGGEADEEAAPRSAALAVVIGGIVLIGVIGYAFYRKNAATAAAPAAPEAPAAAGAEGGVPITAVSVDLSPEASIATERYRCVCSCNDPLSVCTCTQTPGSIDMKQYVQELVAAGRTPAEMDAAMVARYGAAVLLSNPPAAAAAARPPAGDR
jgi:hypothetical protein